jgi:L,D-transpeptidase ErfK/SrfK
VLPDGPPRGIVVNLAEMRLYYFASDSWVLTFPVGLGREGWETPTGRFKIIEKTENPKWVIPAGVRAEHRKDGRPDRDVPGGDPENPLGRYRMRLSEPLYSIHGTNMPWAVGRRTSHGCIRLYPEDIEQLFPRVALGTPVALVHQPVKVGARGGVIYVEVHRTTYHRRFDYRGAARRLLRARGWLGRVDSALLARAIAEHTGVPTPISKTADQGSKA